MARDSLQLAPSEAARWWAERRNLPNTPEVSRAVLDGLAEVLDERVGMGLNARARKRDAKRWIKHQESAA